MELKIPVGSKISKISEILPLLAGLEGLYMNIIRHIRFLGRRLFYGEKLKERVAWLPLTRVFPNPYQPRRIVDEGALSLLVESIRVYGVIVPVLVRPFAGGYQLVAGERRSIAARQLGLSRIPAIVRSLSDSEAYEVSFAENFHRVNLSELEHAVEIAKLAKKLGITPKNNVAAKKDTRSITEKMERANLPVLLRKAVELEIISFSIAKELAHVLDSEAQLALIEQVYKNKFTLEEVSGIVNSYLGRGKEIPEAASCLSVETLLATEGFVENEASFVKHEEKEEVLNMSTQPREIYDHNEVIVRRVLARVRIGGVPDGYTKELEDALNILENDYVLLRRFGRSSVCQLGESLARLYIRQHRLDHTAMEVYEFVASFSNSEQFLLWLCKAYIANHATPVGAEQMFHKLLEQGLWEQLSLEEKQEMEHLLLEELSDSQATAIYRYLLTEGHHRRG